jgi:hypothetical protein
LNKGGTRNVANQDAISSLDLADQVRQKAFRMQLVFLEGMTETDFQGQVGFIKSAASMCVPATVNRNLCAEDSDDGTAFARAGCFLSGIGVVGSFFVSPVPARRLQEMKNTI